MNTLENFGWGQYFQPYKNNNPSFETGRVILIKALKYLLITEKGELEAELSGKLLYGVDNESMPKVGDWVFYIDYGSIGYIVDKYPRMNALVRRSPGSKTGLQVMAANIDLALIVQGLDRDFNLMRLDRYIVQILACNIEPVVILNKSDLIENIDQIKAEVNKLGRNCRVYFCSTLTKEGIEEIIHEVFFPKKTYILIGSSGVGKSSLVNAFTEKATLKTTKISHWTGKGKHTTTTRELYMLPNGSLIIDSPGMREFGLAFEDSGKNCGLFPIIARLAENCRYSDCMHIGESGCAVIEAYNEGTLEPVVYHSYCKLMKEQKHFEIKIEDKKRLGKQFGKMIREVKDFKKKNCQ